MSIKEKSPKEKKNKLIQSEGHPEYNNVCFVDVGTGDRFLTKAAMRSKTKELIDGVEYYIVSRDVTAASSPAYNNTVKTVETGKRMKSFMQKFGARRKAE